MTKPYAVVNRDTQALLEYEEIHGKMRPKPTLHPLGGPLQPTMRKPAQLRGLIATQTSRVVPREAANPPLRRTALMPGAIIKPGRACDQTLAADRSPLPLPQVGHRHLPHAKARLPNQSPVFLGRLLRSKKRKPRLGTAPDGLGTPRALLA